MANVAPNMVLPLPNEKFDGGIVVASVWLRDDEERGYGALLLLLTPEPGLYYRIVEIDAQRKPEALYWHWEVVMRQAAVNIVEAVDFYKENGGDY